MEPDRQSPTTIAVLGASGWIGRAVIDEVARRGHRILAISRRAPFNLPPGADWRRIEDRLTTKGLKSALDGASAIINTAGAAHMAVGPAQSEAVFANAKLPGIVGEAAVRLGIPRLVHLSSIKALGEGGPTPLRATDTPNPTTTYGKGKLTGEHAVQAATAGTGVKLTIVRPPMVYGPGAPANFGRLARLAESPLPVPLPAPYPRRSLTYLGNLASLLSHLAVTLDAAQVVHIADTPHLTTRDLVRCLALAAGAPDLALPVPVRVASRLARRAGREEDLNRLTVDLVVTPSNEKAVGFWIPPFPDHAGFSVSAFSSVSP